METLLKLKRTSAMTILSITHRLQTTVNADQIVVLVGGKVHETGTYEELLSKEGVFSSLVNAGHSAHGDEE